MIHTVRGWKKDAGFGSARQCPSHWQMVRQVVAETLGVDVPLRMMEKWRTQHEKDKFQVLCDLTESPLVPKPAHRGLVVGTTIEGFDDLLGGTA